MSPRISSIRTATHHASGRIGSGLSLHLPSNIATKYITPSAVSRPSFTAVRTNQSSSIFNRVLRCHIIYLRRVRCQIKVRLNLVRLFGWGHISSRPPSSDSLSSYQRSLLPAAGREVSLSVASGNGTSSVSSPISDALSPFRHRSFCFSPSPWFQRFCCSAVRVVPFPSATVPAVLKTSCSFFLRHVPVLRSSTPSQI